MPGSLLSRKAAPMNTNIEVFLIACSNTLEMLYYRVEIPCVTESYNPDELVVRKLTDMGIDSHGCSAISHSTSWRCQNGRILLTYIVTLPSSILTSLPTTTLNTAEVICPESAAAMKPHPAEIEDKHVLVHGLRHLSFLVFHQNDRQLATAMRVHGTIAFLNRLQPTVAGQLLSQPPASEISYQN